MAKTTDDTTAAEVLEAAQAAFPDATVSDEWETILTGLGAQWDFERDGPLTGYLIGVQTVETDDPQNPGQKRLSNAYQFSSDATPQDIVFIWGSSDIDAAMQESKYGVLPAGTRCRITYLGRETFQGQKGPQQIKRYRTQVVRNSIMQRGDV